MELLQPTVTITNAEDGFWLVRVEHNFDAHQRLDITVKIQKHPQQPLLEVIRIAVARMWEMLPPSYR